MRRSLFFACSLATFVVLAAAPVAPALATPPRGSMALTVGQLNGAYEMWVDVHAIRGITLASGTLLGSGNDDEQRVMINETLKLDPGQTASVQVFCIDPRRTMAMTGTTMHVIGPAPGPVAAIFAAAGGVTPEVLQRAIWAARGAPEFADGQPEVVALLRRAHVPASRTRS